MFLSCYKARHSFSVAEADWTVEQAADTQTPTHSSIPEVWGVTLCHWVGVAQHFEDVGAFTFNSKESRRILLLLMAPDGKCTVIL